MKSIVTSLIFLLFVFDCSGQDICSGEQRCFTLLPDSNRAGSNGRVCAAVAIPERVHWLSMSVELPRFLLVERVPAHHDGAEAPLIAAPMAGLTAHRSGFAATIADREGA